MTDTAAITASDKPENTPMQSLITLCHTKRHAGFTLIELLVALSISTVVAIAAFSGLMISRQGFTAVDAASQLRDNARFAGDLLQRLVIQTGYLSDRSISTPPVASATSSSNPPPNVSGFNNALADSSNPTTSSISRGSSSLDGSDVLILRFQADETFSGSSKTDSSMIDCAGTPITAAAIDRQDRVWSVLHLALGSDNEPSLYCSVSGSSPQPVIRGVETFQVLYGVDTVTAGVAPAAGAAVANVANAYLRADQMTVPGDPVGTNANWSRVRSIRIGMVLRGSVGSSPVASDADTVYYPFGSGAKASGGDKGSALAAASSDQGTVFKPGSDTRLRQVVTFTIHLRNDQNV